MKVIKGKENQRIYNKISHISSDSKKGILSAFNDLAVELKKTNKKDFRAKKSGRFYFVRKNGKIVRHRASAPGEPPAIISGNLDKSIATKTASWNQLDYSAGSEKAFYAKSLEFGTSKVLKRPYMIKAINDNQRNTETYFNIRIEHQLKKL